MIQPQDRRLIASLAIQLLKESEDMTANGDFRTCLRYERKYRETNGNIGPLPATYRYADIRIWENCDIAMKILETVDAAISMKEATDGR